MKKRINDELFHVEHSEYSASRLAKLLLLAILLLIPACKSEDPEPEKKDFIYLDLLKEEASAKASIEKELKKLEGFEKDFNKSEVRTIDRKSAIRDINNSKESIRKYEQKAEYYRIALIKRQSEARASYKRAFSADKPWPDSKEFDSYMQNKKMQEVSRNWSTRVPKPGSSSIEEPKSGSREAAPEAAEGAGAEGETPAAEGH